MIWLSFLLLIGTYIFVFRTPYGLRLRAVGEHPRAADTVGISVYKVRYIAVIGSGAIAALGGAYLSIGFVHSFSEDMTAGIGLHRRSPRSCSASGGRSRRGARRCSSGSRARSPTGCRPPTATNGAPSSRRCPTCSRIIAVAGVIGRSVGPAAAGRPYDKQ